MTSPPKGRYPSNKRHRLSGSSAHDSDDDSDNNDGSKRHRSQSPECTQQEVHIKQKTPPKDKAQPEEGQTSQKTVRTLPQAIHSGAQLRAPGWTKFFLNYPSLDPKQPQQPIKKATKNGGRGKSTKTTTSSKNGQHPDGKKTGK